MGISTTSKKISPEERRKRVAELRKFHEPYFEAIGRPDAHFTGKMRYGFPYHSTKFFEAEINKPETIYVEWTSRDCTPEDNRRLYKYEPNPNYKEEYKSETDDYGKVWYIIPIEKFILVKDEMVIETKIEQVEVETKEEPQQVVMDLDFGIINPDEDCPLDNVTLRDITAILLKAPVSRKEWLNKIISDLCQK